MIAKRLIFEANQLTMFLSVIQGKEISHKSFPHNSLKGLILPYKPCYNMSGRKPIPKQRVPLPITSSQSTTTMTQTDMAKLKTHQMFNLLKNDIRQSIKQSDDSERLMEIVEYYAHLFSSNFRYKDAIIEFDTIRKLMQANSAYKASPIYHFVLCQLKYYFAKLGRYEEAIAVNQKSYALMKKNSQKDNLAIANELTTLAILHFTNKNYAEARKFIESELKITKEVCDDTFLEMIECKNNMAIVDFAEGKYDIALKAFQKNAQISQVIMKSNKKSKKQLMFGKHFAYLEGIYEMKLHESTNNQQKASLKSKIFTSIQQLKDIIKQNGRLQNDFYRFYETIAEHYLQKGKYEVCLMFIKKAMALNEEKMVQPLVSGKSSKNLFEISNHIARQLKLMAAVYENLGQDSQAFQHYLKSMTRYQQSMLSTEAKQCLDLPSVQNFIDCCKCLFRLKFILQKDVQKAFGQALKYMEAPLLVWSTMIDNVWNSPQYLTFVPYELNIEIGVKLLELQQPAGALQYFQVCIKQIESHKAMLCSRSKKTFRNQSDRIEKALKNLTEQYRNNLPELKQVLSKLKTFSR